jgi:GTP cyclohydrolase FolE2
LRRLDEKQVTERMFAAPNFVEDVVRNAVKHIQNKLVGIAYSVRCESNESIHPHNAYAETSGKI